MTPTLVLGKIRGQEVIVPPAAMGHSRVLAGHVANLLGLPEIESSLAGYWSLSVRKAQWEAVVNSIAESDPHGLRYLEIGSGLGMFVVVGTLLGLECMGVEPGEDRYQGSLTIARQVLQANGLPDHLIDQGYGEQLNFPDASFGVVCSFQTLEHVADPVRMLCEVNRVLKPGGFLILQCPNYRYPYEGHYGLILPCPLGRALTLLALRLYRRPTEFLSHLNWVTPRRVRKWLASARFVDVRVTDMLKNQGCELPVEAYPLPFKFTRGARPVSIVQRVLNLPLLRYVTRLCEIYPQIACVARKAP